MPAIFSRGMEGVVLKTLEYLTLQPVVEHSFEMASGGSGVAAFVTSSRGPVIFWDCSF